MSDVLAEVLPIGKLRLVPGVQYRVIKEFTDDSDIVHPVGERWIYLGFEQPKMYPGYVVHTLYGNDRKLSFRIRWSAEGQPEIVQAFERFVTGPVVPTDRILARLSPEGVDAFERVRHWMEPLPTDSDLLLELVQLRRRGARIAAYKDDVHMQQPSIDLARLLHEFEAALRGVDA